MVCLLGKGFVLKTPGEKTEIACKMNTFLQTRFFHFNSILVSKKKSNSEKVIDLVIPVVYFSYHY